MTDHRRDQGDAAQIAAQSIDVSEPMIMAGLLIGAMMPFLFSSFAMKAVGDAAFEASC